MEGTSGRSNVAKCMDISKLRSSSDSCFFKLILLGVVIFTSIALFFTSSFNRNYIFVNVTFVFIFIYISYVILYIFRAHCIICDRDKSNPSLHSFYLSSFLNKKTHLHILRNLITFFALPSILILNLPIFLNCAPVLSDLELLDGNCSNDFCTGYEGNWLIWEAKANDIDNDNIYYKFLKIGLDNKITYINKNYILIERWSWKPGPSDIGNITICAMVIDKKHKNESGYDDIFCCDCIIKQSNHTSEVTLLPKKEQYSRDTEYTFEIYPYEQKLKNLEQEVHQLVPIILSTHGPNHHVTPEPEPEPVVTPEPRPVVTPEPEPVVTPEPEPEPVVTPEPRPVVTPEPEPVVTPEPEPVVTPEPEPVVTPEPGPVVTPEPRPLDHVPDKVDTSNNIISTIKSAFLPESSEHSASNTANPIISKFLS